MRILLATPELSPWAREGSTGDAAAGLARGLRRAGTDVTVVVPDYPVFSGLPGLVRKRRHVLRHAAPSSLGAAWTSAELDGLKLVLVENPQFFGRPGIYGGTDEAYADNFARFAFFARLVRHIAGALKADLVHGLDWPGALVAAVGGRGQAPATLGLENMRFQGDFSRDIFPQLVLPWQEFGRFEFYGRGNSLKAGLLAAAATVLPGRRMAQAVQGAGFGCGLEGVAAEVAPRLHGILAGADYDGWLDARTAEGRERKEAARREWLASTGLGPLPDDGLLVVCAPALCGGRGLDLLLPLVDRLMEFPVRLVVLGRAPLGMAPALELLSIRHEGQFRVCAGGDDAVLRNTCAAADAILVPDALNPGDLRVACAMRSGAVPLVQACPGLHEVVEDHDPAGHPGTGLVFYRHDPEALWDNFMRALALRRVGGWSELSGRAASTDFSWEAAGPRYAGLFGSIVPSAAGKF